MGLSKNGVPNSQILDLLGDVRMFLTKVKVRYYFCLEKVKKNTHQYIKIEVSLTCLSFLA